MCIQLVNMTAVITARVDADLQEQFENFKQSNNLTNSAAVRLLISMGLANVYKLDEQWAKAALKEGQFAGVRQIHRALASQLQNGSETEKG